MGAFRSLKIVTQTDHIEAGGMMDDCAWASLAAIANHITGSNLDCGDGIAIGEKVGRHDRDGKGDGSSLAQMKKAAPLVGLKARYPKSWDDVVAALANPDCALALSVQQPIGYPDSVMPISKWHKNSWAPWAKVHDPKGFKSGYGHLTAAAGHATGAQWACPTRSGKGAEALAQPLSVDDLRKIASSHGDTPHKRVLIFSALNKDAAQINVDASQAAQEARQPEKATGVPSTAQQGSTSRKSGSQSDLARSQAALKDAMAHINWSEATANGLAISKAALAAAGKGSTMSKIKNALAYIANNTQLDEMLLDATRSFVLVSISVALGLGIPLLQIDGPNWSVVLSAGLASALQVIVKFLDPDNSAYGITKK
jgi:hypothetical protein